LKKWLREGASVLRDTHVVIVWLKSQKNDRHLTTSHTYIYVCVWLL